MPLKSIFSLLFALCVSAGFGQVDSNAVFLASKGSWEYPLQDKYEIQGLLDGPILNNATFYSNKPKAIHALMPGHLVANIEIDGMHVVIVKFGDYFLTYSNLQKISLKKGDYIEKGQLISFSEKGFLEGKYYVDIFLCYGKEDIDLNIPGWFKKDCKIEPFKTF